MWVRPLEDRGVMWLVETDDGEVSEWNAGFLLWLHAVGLVRCACGRCGEATTQ